MLLQKIKDKYLVDELQLGNRLNDDIQNHNRADFDLLLSLISQDVLDFPFYQDEKEQVKDEDLRAKFQLPKSMEKYAKAQDFENSANLSELLQTQGQRSLFLNQCLNPEPLVAFDHQIKPDVFNQLTPLKQYKLLQEQSGAAIGYENWQEQGSIDVLDEIEYAKAN